MPQTFIRATFALAMVFVLTTESFSQDFRPGFVVTNDGDSIGGFISNRSQRKNFNSCRFKQSLKSQTIVYKPTELKSFGIYGYRQYESKEITTKGEKKVVFLELLVDGKLSLWNKRDIFFIQKDSFKVLPPDIRTKVQVDGKVYNKTDLRYMADLNAAIRDCDINVDKIEYAESELVDLVIRYNKCKGVPGKEIKAEIPRNHITWNLLFGVDQSQTKLDSYEDPSSSHIPLSSFHINPSISVPAGVGLEWSRPSRNDKLFFGLELWYDKKFWQGYAETVSNSGTLRSDVFINTSYLKMPLNIRFDLKQDKNTPYLRLGFTHYFPITSSGKYLDELENNGKVITTRDKIDLKKKSPEGFWFGLGYSLRLFGNTAGFIEGRYEINNGFTNPSVDSHSSGVSASVLMGLKF